MPNFAKTEAIVLNTKRWRESSKIVHLFTADFGYLNVVAKGAFRPKSPFRGLLESLNHLEVVFSHRDKRDLQILTAATLVNSFLNTRENLQKTAVAFSILELIKKMFSTHEPVIEFFQYTTSWLTSLDAHSQIETKGYLWHFLFKLSQTLGFGWELEKCQRRDAVPEVFPVFLDYRSGGILCPGTEKHHASAERPLNRKTWEQLSKLSKISTDKLPELTRTGQFLSRPDVTEILLKHLEYHTESRVELKSLNWYV